MPPALRRPARQQCYALPVHCRHWSAPSPKTSSVVARYRAAALYWIRSPTLVECCPRTASCCRRQAAPAPTEILPFERGWQRRKSGWSTDLKNRHCRRARGKATGSAAKTLNLRLGQMSALDVRSPGGSNLLSRRIGMSDPTPSCPVSLLLPAMNLAIVVGQGLESCSFLPSSP